MRVCHPAVLQTLTSHHFLIADAVNVVPEPNMTDIDMKQANSITARVVTDATILVTLGEQTFGYLPTTTEMARRG